MDAGIETLEKIRDIRGRLSPKLRVVADIILVDPDIARSKNINELAILCSVSEATLSRFVRSIGFHNYRDFQLRLAKESSPGRQTESVTFHPQHIHEDIARNDSVQTVIAKIAHRSANSARACLTTLDRSALEEAAQMVCRARTIYFFAAGLSVLAAQSALLRFSRIGKPSIFYHDRNTQLLIAGSLQPGALAIGISDSGRTNQTLSAITIARQAGAATLAVTSFPDSSLARQCDVSLITPAGYASATEELFYESMVSKFGQLVAIDALYALAAVQDFDNSVNLIGRGDDIICQSRKET